MRHRESEKEQEKNGKNKQQTNKKYQTLSFWTVFLIFLSDRSKKQKLMIFNLINQSFVFFSKIFIGHKTSVQKYNHEGSWK